MEVAGYDLPIDDNFDPLNQLPSNIEVSIAMKEKERRQLSVWTLCALCIVQVTDFAEKSISGTPQPGAPVSAWRPKKL